jgi:ribulose-phosphate 3-epimerase
MEKLTKVRDAFPNLNIQVDGGVKRDNMHIPIKAGANVLVSGTGLFGQDDPATIIKEMKDAIDEVTNNESS